MEQMNKKERPMLFSTPMVIALMNGTKTMTRRLVKPQPSDAVTWDSFGYSALTPPGHIEGRGQFPEGYGSKFFKCPYGNVGDVIWVRETFFNDADYGESPVFVYKANNETFPRGSSPWKPSIHMPRIACRIRLEITEVRIERLNDISEVDAINEGVELLPEQKAESIFSYRSYVVKNGGSGVAPYVSFRTLWQAINGRESWDSNPWVWVVKFKKL